MGGTGVAVAGRASANVMDDACGDDGWTDGRSFGQCGGGHSFGWLYTYATLAGQHRYGGGSFCHFAHCEQKTIQYHKGRPVKIIIYVIKTMRGTVSTRPWPAPNLINNPQYVF